MVHLARIATDADVADLKEGLADIKLEPIQEDEDHFSTTVYGSRFAAEDLPKHEIPEREMPKEV